MKYLKKYEIISEKGLQIGDYVVCCDSFLDVLELNDFLINNIGRFVIFDNNKVIQQCKIEFENIPKKLSRQDYFNGSNYRWMMNREILFYSENEEDCELYINSKKYNV